MHPSTDINEIKKEIEVLNHKVIRITNILNNRTKRPLLLFYIELQQQSNNKDIYETKYLLNIIINFKQPYKKRDIPQDVRHMDTPRIIASGDRSV